MIEAQSAGYVLDRATLTIRFERELDADCSEVFDAWTKPEDVTMWWDPDGEPLVTCSIDLRVGGSFSFATRQHSEVPFAGVYRVIERPHALEFDAMGATGRVRLDVASGRTIMRVEISCRSEEAFEQFAKLAVAVGTARTLDNLVAYLA